MHEMKKIISRKKLLFTTLILYAHILSAQQQEKNTDDTPFFREPLSKYTKEDWENNGEFNEGIEFFYDQMGAQFVLKHQSTPELAIHEILGGRVGKTIGKNLVNEVIPAPIHIPSEKKFSYGQATLHTHAPGRAAHCISIKTGLAHFKNLEHITENEDLAKIVALNFHLDDQDCNKNNLFFDPHTNHYCAIDKALIFRSTYNLKNGYNHTYIDHNSYQSYKLQYILPTALHNNQLLATDACDFLENIKKEDLSTAQIDALKLVGTTLKSLMIEYPPTKLHSEWMNIAQDLNFHYPDETKEDISILIEYNNHENKRLLSLIDKITDK
jgi:hypothetical protein